MSGSQLNTGGTTGTIDSAITTAQFLDNFTSGVYDLETFPPRFLPGKQKGGFRVLAREILFKKKRTVGYRPVSLLITDLVSDQVAGPLASTGDILAGIVGSAGNRAVVQTGFPGSLSATLGVRFPVNSQVVITAITSTLTVGQTAVSNSAVQLTSTAGGSDFFAVKNLDATLEVDLGISSVTFGTGFRLAPYKSVGDSAIFPYATPSAFYAIRTSAATTKVAWAIQ